MTTINLTVADLLKRLRDTISAEAERGCPDPSSPHLDSAKNAALHRTLNSTLRQAADDLSRIADDDYKGLVSWEWRYSNDLANCCGRTGASAVAASRLVNAIHGGSQYSLTDGVFGESFTERYQRLV